MEHYPTPHMEDQQLEYSSCSHTSAPIPASPPTVHDHEMCAPVLSFNLGHDSLKYPNMLLSNLVDI